MLPTIVMLPDSRSLLRQGSAVVTCTRALPCLWCEPIFSAMCTESSWAVVPCCLPCTMSAHA